MPSVLVFCCFFFKIGKEEVEVGKDIPRRNFRVSCEADSQPKTLQHSVDVKGTDRDELFFTIFIRPSNRNTSPVMPGKHTLVY